MWGNPRAIDGILIKRTPAQNTRCPQTSNGSIITVRRRLTEEKPSSMAVSKRFGHKIIVVIAPDIRGIYYYEILPGNETMNAARYVELLKRFTDY